MTKKLIEEMSPEELKAYEEELDKKIKFSELKKKQEQLDNEVAEKLKKEQEEADKLAKEKALVEIYKEHPNWKIPDKLNDSERETVNTSVEGSKLQKNYVKYYKQFENLRTKSGNDAKLINSKDMNNFQIYKNQRWGNVSADAIFSNTDSDTGCEDDVSSWSPDDVYAKVIWNTAVCKADLFKICVKGIAINPGQGLGVQIRAYGAAGDPVSLDACGCGSCASLSYTTYSISLKQYNMEAIICDMDLWDVGEVLMDANLQAMSDSWARWFDEQIYAQLETATPGTDTELATALACSPSLDGSCCSDVALLELYNAVQTTVASMRQGTGLAGPVNPDYIIISPSVAAIFKRMSTPQPMPWLRDVSFDDSGRLTKIGGLKCIEYCGANACTDATGEAVAIIIDSSRAVGAVFGQRPKLYKFFQSNCNSYRLDYWSYFGCAELSTDHIAHITNP